MDDTGVPDVAAPKPAGAGTLVEPASAAPAPRRGVLGFIRRPRRSGRDRAA